MWCSNMPQSTLQVVGSHQLTSEQKDRATKRRAKLEAETNRNKAREQQEAFQMKKQERLLEEKVGCAVLTAIIQQLIHVWLQCHSNMAVGNESLGN